MRPLGEIIGAPPSWYYYGWPPRVDWYRLETIYRTFPMATYAVEQLAEQAISPGYYLKNSGSTKAVEICESFDANLTPNSLMAQMRICRELAIYGNSPVERRFDDWEKEDDNDFRIKRLGEFVDLHALPITTMRVVPDRFTGTDPPYGYAQLIMSKYHRFAPEQIAWFKVNVTGGAIGSDFYGMGLLQPISDYVWGLEQMEEGMIRVMKRYAASKILWTLGDKDTPAIEDAIKNWAASLENVKFDEDWVGSFLVHAQLISPDVRARFEEWTDHFKSTITAGVQNPNLLLAMIQTRVSDASATAMQQAWDRKVTTFQTGVKELWEDLVYKPLVVQEGLDEGQTPELIYGQPETINPQEEIAELTTLLNPGQVQLSPPTRFDIENKVRQLMGFDPLPANARPPVTPPAPPATPASAPAAPPLATPGLTNDEIKNALETAAKKKADGQGKQDDEEDDDDED